MSNRKQYFRFAYSVKAVYEVQEGLLKCINEPELPEDWHKEMSIYQLEYGRKYKLHWQGALVLKSKKAGKTLRQVINVLSRNCEKLEEVEVKPMESSTMANVHYCGKPWKTCQCKYCIKAREIGNVQNISFEGNYEKYIKRQKIYLESDIRKQDKKNKKENMKKILVKDIQSGCSNTDLFPSHDHFQIKIFITIFPKQISITTSRLNIFY